MELILKIIAAIITVFYLISAGIIYHEEHKTRKYPIIFSVFWFVMVFASVYSQKIDDTSNQTTQ